MRLMAAGLVLAAMMGGCAHQGKETTTMGEGGATPARFSDDVDFLKKHMDVVVLKSGDAQVAVSPKLQGRVMTSTAGGSRGLSFGWINRELIGSDKTVEHFNPNGGEDRFWLGPEAGQFGIFFGKGPVAFDLPHWYVPAAIDTEPFELVSKSNERADFHRRFQVVNYSGTTFDVDVARQVALLSTESAWQKLGVAPAGGVKVVAYETINKVTNAGRQPWKKETGLLSIWILGMFNPSPTTTIVIPIKQGDESTLGAPVNADYFGRVPPERLVVKEGVVYFSADGTYRSKIGVNPRRAKPILGSYDATNKVLTLIQYTAVPGRREFVNSMWELQKDAYSGDVVNAYNDGPPTPGAKPLGPFYELESSSPAAALQPGESVEHVHRTMHLAGNEPDLDRIARATLGVGIEQIKSAMAN